MDDVLAEQIAYYRARAGEYDDWWVRRGRYALLSDLERDWFADVAEAEAALRDFASALTPCREIGEEDHPGVEPLYVVQHHPNGSPVAEHVDVSVAPDERVEVDLVLVDQALLGEGVRKLAAAVHE
jgi:hypothetical protein